MDRCVLCVLLVSLAREALVRLAMLQYNGYSRTITLSVITIKIMKYMLMLSYILVVRDLVVRELFINSFHYTVYCSIKK